MENRFKVGDWIRYVIPDVPVGYNNYFETAFGPPPYQVVSVEEETLCIKTNNQESPFNITYIFKNFAVLHYPVAQLIKEVLDET